MVGRRKNPNQSIAFHRGVIEEQNVVSVLGCNWKIFEATEITSAHVVLRNGVTTYSNTFGNPHEVDLDTFGADVDEYDFKAPANFTRVSHQVKVALTRKRCLNRKALSPLDVLLGQTENLTAGGHS